MKRAALKPILIGVLLSCSSALPAQQDREPAEPMKLFVDFARFRGTGERLYVELYYSFSQRCLTYRMQEGRMEAGIDLSINVARRDSLVFQDRWRVPHYLEDTTATGMSMSLVSISAVELPDGDYTATVIGKDYNNPDRADTVRLIIPIRKLGQEQVILSDIELSSRILEGSPDSPFYKNTLEVVPNAQGIFGEQQVCYLYAEIYNLQAGQPEMPYSVRTVVLDAARREVHSKTKPRNRTSESGVVVDQIVVGRMYTGTYTVGIMVIDSTDKILTSSGKKIFVYNPQLGIDSTLAVARPTGLASVYSAMSEAELDEEFSQARYEAQNQDKTQYEGLTEVDAKRAFLIEFWARRPPGLRDEYMARVIYANRYYRVLGRPGYRTDRGRVHIVYGPPSDFERHPNEPESRPYEIWTYEEIQGGVIFVFVQRVANGEFELVHSTHRNEIQDDQWYQKFAQTAY